MTPLRLHEASCGDTEASPGAAPSIGVLFVGFARLGATSFGGPAMIAQIERFVTERHWLPREVVLSGVAIAQFLPGATAMQLAAFVGYRLRGAPGAAAAFLGFGIHAFLLMLVLSASYRTVHGNPLGASVFTGLQAVVAAIVTHVALGFGRRTLKGGLEGLIAAASAASFLAGQSPILIVAIAASVAALLLPKHAAACTESVSRPVRGRDFRLPLALLLVGAAMAMVLRQFDSGLFDLALVMAKVDLFAFGGAYGSLPLMLHEVVEVRHWLEPSAFFDGIALGQITPGPIVIAATFVGWSVAALPGAVVATAAVFFPSFLILIAAMPVVEMIRGHRLAAPATRGTTAAVAGLIAATAVKLILVLPPSASVIGIGLASLVALIAGLGPLWVVAGGALAAMMLGGQ